MRPGGRPELGRVGPSVVNRQPHSAQVTGPPAIDAPRRGQAGWGSLGWIIGASRSGCGDHPGQGGTRVRLRIVAAGPVARRHRARDGWVANRIQRGGPPAEGRPPRVPQEPWSGHGVAQMAPNEPCDSSSGPAAKNSVVVGPAAAPLPKPIPHRPSTTMALPFASRTRAVELPVAVQPAVGVDPTVAEVADEQVAAEPSEAGRRRPGQTPRGVQRAARGDPAEEVCRAGRRR